MNSSPVRAMVLILSITSTLRAQVPQLLNYQGRVAVAGVNFHGAGQFKFVLVAEVPGRPLQSLWSNDGTSVEGNEPLQAVTLPVAKGLYSVLLGDTTLANMIPVPATVFTNSNVSLRVWFNDGTQGSQLLSPDQRIASVGYAMMADDLKDGAITAAKLSSGAVQGPHLAAGAAAANLQAGGQSAVAGGGLILSATLNPLLENAGYVQAGSTTLSDGWQALSNVDVPSARDGHSSVWTGSEMIVWGGVAPPASFHSDGGRWLAATNTWTPVAGTNVISARLYHTAVWTGTEMLVWGGVAGPVEPPLGDGARFNPATGAWASMSSVGAPAGRYTHTAVWTGSLMVIWGGFGAGAWRFDDGGRYDPGSNTWLPVDTSQSPTWRNNHTAIWTGTEMLVWGGNGTNGAELNDGARYNPATNTWTSITSLGAPAGRSGHQAVWTGSEMIVWGGTDSNAYLNDGGRYNPLTDSWLPLRLQGAPAGRTSFSAAWTGSEMIIWGGVGTNGLARDGARYQPETNSWEPLSTLGAPARRRSHSMVWTGSRMLIWGGLGVDEADGDDTYPGDTFSYTPGRTMFLYQRP